MQEKRRAAVYAALLPLAIGHTLAVVAAVVIAVAIGTVIPVEILKWILAATLLALGISRFFRHHHPRGSGMKVGMGGLTLWSFLMASAHGAGLMVVPLFLGMNMTAAQHGHQSLNTSSAPVTFLVTGVHAAGYLMVTALVAALVFEKLGGRPAASGLVQPRPDLGDRARCNRQPEPGPLAIHHRKGELYDERTTCVAPR
jgi:hypothetical protein